MERLIQLLDEVDDMRARLSMPDPTPVVACAAVGALMLVLLRVGVYWPLAVLVALPVAPVVDLFLAGVRRALPAGFTIPLRAMFDIET